MAKKGLDESVSAVVSSPSCDGSVHRCITGGVGVPHEQRSRRCRDLVPLQVSSHQYPGSCSSVPSTGKLDSKGHVNPCLFRQLGHCSGAEIRRFSPLYSSLLVDGNDSQASEGERSSPGSLSLGGGAQCDSRHSVEAHASADRSNAQSSSSYMDHLRLVGTRGRSLCNEGQHSPSSLCVPVPGRSGSRFSLLSFSSVVSEAHVS